MPSGTVYILINPAFKDLLKIGKTTRTAEERATEISNGTGIPSKFVVAYEDFVADCDLAERRIFEILSQHRYESNREFFALKLRDAIPIVMDVVVSINAEVEEESRRREQAINVVAEKESRLRKQAIEEVELEEQRRKKALKAKEQAILKKCNIQLNRDSFTVEGIVYDLSDLTYAGVSIDQPKRSTFRKILLVFIYILCISCALLTLMPVLFYGFNPGILEGTSEGAAYNFGLIVGLLLWCLIPAFFVWVLWFLHRATRPLATSELFLLTESGETLIPLAIDVKSAEILDEALLRHRHRVDMDFNSIDAR
jgi:hypothetical protein